MENRIREMRVRSRLTQTELARLIGAHESEVSRWEGGVRQLPADTISSLARVFKIESWELFQEPGRRNRRTVSRATKDNGPSVHARTDANTELPG